MSPVLLSGHGTWPAEKAKSPASILTEHLEELQHGIPVARGDSTTQRQPSEGRRERAPSLAVRMPRVDFFARHPEQLWLEVSRKQRGDLRLRRRVRQEGDTQVCRVR